MKNIFSTQLGESLIAKGLMNQIEKGAEISLSALLKGTSAPIKIQETAQSKSQKNKSGYHAISNAKFKPDVSSGKDYVQIRVNDNKDVISVAIGLSVKTYIGNLSQVSVVSNKPFTSILDALFMGGKYHVYNTLGLLPKTQEAYRNMKKAIILSYADYFLSGTGSPGDFSQFIVINGEYYPVLDILENIAKNTKGSLSGDEDNSDPLQISIQNAGKLIDIRNKAVYGGPRSLEKAWNRNVEMHKQIGKGLKIMGHLNTTNLTKI